MKFRVIISHSQSHSFPSSVFFSCFRVRYFFLERESDEDTERFTPSSTFQSFFSSLGQKKDTELVLSYFRPNQIQKSSLHESRNCFIKKSYTCLLNGSLILQERKVLLSLTHSSLSSLVSPDLTFITVSVVSNDLRSE